MRWWRASEWEQEVAGDDLLASCGDLSGFRGHERTWQQGMFCSLARATAIGACEGHRGDTSTTEYQN